MTPFYYGLSVLAVMTCAAFVEHCFGRVLFCSNGSIHFWVGSPTSPEVSQQIADWYSFSHLIHGFALYGISYLIGKRLNWSVSLRLLCTAILEATWEMLENSPIIINRYRQTAAQGYTGDSILT